MMVIIHTKNCEEIMKIVNVILKDERIVNMILKDERIFI